MKPARNTWKPLVTADGSPTLRHPVHGQACHTADGAWLEARERYARACRLDQLARRTPGARVHLLDLGTGLGWNLAAALESVERAGGHLEAVGFELETGPIAAALNLPSPADAPWEPWWGKVRRTLRAALEAGAPARAGLRLPLGSGPEAGNSPSHHLTLYLGDARQLVPTLPDRPSFDACFLDPFSPGVEQDLWSPTFLRAVARRLAPGAWLSTYSASLSVREALAAAGLRVGPGPRVGAKSAGTLASPDLDPGPLDRRTAGKLARRLARRAAEDSGRPGA